MTGEYQSIHYEYKVVDQEHDDNLDVELGISVNGEQVLVSFTFDVTHDDANTVAQEMCEEYNVPDQKKTVAATLKKYR